MSINQAMYNGLSGLNGYSTAMSVVSDNIANSNTTAFKSNSVRFGDMVNSYYSIFASGTQGSGVGVQVLGFSTDYAQGTLLDTSNWSDLAMSGEGFFTLVNPVSTRTYYSRDGSFNLDKDGYLINNHGYRVQGYEDGAGDLGDIQIPNPTDYVSIRVETNGDIVAVDNQGAAEVLYTLALSSFSNKNGLVRDGGNLYITGPDVGLSFNNQDNPEIFGLVNDYSLEGSNVDLAKQMVDMIIYQASYNANSKTITTSSQMIDTSINMVR